jgi:hypothetical protein
VTARSVLQKLKTDLDWPIEIPKIIRSSEKDYEPSLLAFLQLPEKFKVFYPTEKWKENLYSFSNAAKVTTKKRVILLGTCHSERLKKTPYGLGPLLASFLGRELIDVSEQGSNSVKSLLELEEKGFKIRSSDLIVWDFNFREPLDHHQKQRIIDLLSSITSRSLTRDISNQSY